MSTTNLVIGVGVGIAVGWIMRGSARPLMSLLRRGKMKPMTNVNATFLIVFGFRIRHLSALVDKTNNVNFTCQFTLFS